MIKYPKYNKLIKSFFQVDMIRLQKLLHMSQNAIITAAIAFFIGVKVNTLFEENEKEENTLETTIKLIMHMILIIISMYYSRKLTKFIPFIFRMTKSYDPFHKSSDGEALFGSTLALGLLLMSTQTNIKKRISKLHQSMLS
tara:strand:+ start:1355 stop:1777 length:423 start_codon:yes stop_codon:yes gene_type:complete